MKKIFVMGCCLAALVLTGCQNTVNTVENTDKNGTPVYIRDTRFITDGAMNDRLALKRVTVSENQEGFMRVQLEVVNIRTGVFAQLWSNLTGDNPYVIQYCFSWLTKDGMKVDTITADWQTVSIIPGETVYLQSVAPRKDCKDFKVDLKEAD